MKNGCCHKIYMKYERKKEKKEEEEEY